MSRYNTRIKRNLCISKFKLECAKRDFQDSGIKAWNEIPIDHRQRLSLCRFKRKLEKHLKSSVHHKTRLMGRSDLNQILASNQFSNLISISVS